jgi:hypothetical protein
VIGYGLDARCSIHGSSKIFLFSTASRTALGSTQLPIQWVPGTLSPGEKLSRREAYHTPSRAEVNNGGAIPPLPTISLWQSAELIKHRDNLTNFTLVSLFG